MDAQLPHTQLRLTPESYPVNIAGEIVDLPLVAINETLAILLLMVIDMGVRFGDRVGKAIAARLADKSPDVVVGMATLGIPVAIISGSINTSCCRSRRKSILRARWSSSSNPSLPQGRSA